MNYHNKNQKGSILILTLWVLSFLTIFAVQIGLKARQRILVLSRVEDRSQLHYLSQAGMKKAIAAIRKDAELSFEADSSYGKYFRHNNPGLFSRIRLGDNYSDVKYYYYERSGKAPTTRYGVVDEESKININFASREELRRLMDKVVFIDRGEALNIVEAILSWRSLGETQIEGFYSDNYYQALEYPYSPKHNFFEYPDELLLLQGITPKLFDKLSFYITIYGDGRVNINTAPREVLYALGLDEAVVEKIISVRQGDDGIDFTRDDYIFQKTYDIASEIKQWVDLKELEAKQIDYLNKFNRIKTRSTYYFIRSVARLGKQKEPLVSLGVFNSTDNRLEYYKEGR